MKYGARLNALTDARETMRRVVRSIFIVVMIGTPYSTVYHSICEEMVLGDWESDRVGNFKKKRGTQ